MREIKFRAWDKNAKEMMLPEFSEWEEFFIEPDGTVLRAYETGGYYTQMDRRIISDEVILMQWTGLKDKNGKEIYEGDLINVSNDQTGFVEFVDGYFRNSVSHWGLHTYLSMPLPYKIPEIEVIGNRYENPELLEK